MTHRHAHAPQQPLPQSVGAVEPDRRASGIIMMLCGSASNQAGAALGALAFPAIGPVGVVAMRQLVTAAVLLPVVRPRFRGLTRRQRLLVLGLAAVFGIMNLALYAAIERIGLGLAVTLEFLGPLTVAIAGSRRLIDVAGALLAGGGVVMLTQPGPATDVPGVALALVAAAAWGCYILLNRSAGRQLPGLQGTAAASIVAAGVWLPITTVWFILHPPAITALLLAAACGVLCSVVPYVADLSALRRVPASMFSALTSVNPVWAALAGWLVLGQTLSWSEGAGIGLIAVGNALVAALGFRAR